MPVRLRNESGNCTWGLSLNKILVRYAGFGGCFFRQNERNNKKVTEWVAVILLIHSILLILPKIAVKNGRILFLERF